MNGPSCQATTTKKRTQNTKLGDGPSFCSHCHLPFHERTGPPFNSLAFPRDIVLLAVFWRLREKLSLRDSAEMFFARGFPFTHQALRHWEARFAPLRTDHLRAKRRGQAGKSWDVDETSRHVCMGSGGIGSGRSTTRAMWGIRCSREKRNMEAAQRFLKQAVAVVGHVAEQVIPDGHPSYSRAICQTMGSDILHWKNTYLKKKLEQDHRGIKQRYSPMRGFGTFEAAACCCCAFDE